MLNARGLLGALLIESFAPYIQTRTTQVFHTVLTIWLLNVSNMKNLPSMRFEFCAFLASYLEGRY